MWCQAPTRVEWVKWVVGASVVFQSPRWPQIRSARARVHGAYTARTVIHSLLYTNRLWAEGRHARTKSFPDLGWAHLGVSPS